MSEALTTRDHWWWRPGWRFGRSFYTWHLTFQSSPEMGRIVSAFRSSLSAFSTLDLVEPCRIHLTFQGVGFADEVSFSDIKEIADRVSQRCKNFGQLRILLKRPHVDIETVQINVGPIEALTELRRRVRSGIGDVWPDENIPESASDFRPHITLAYSNGVSSILKIKHSIRSIPLPVTELGVDSIYLIRLNRDNRQYEWVNIAEVSL